MLVLLPWDDHTNAIGHKLLADKLYAELSHKLSRVVRTPPKSGPPIEVRRDKVD